MLASRLTSKQVTSKSYCSNRRCAHAMAKRRNSNTRKCSQPVQLNAKRNSSVDQLPDRYWSNRILWNCKYKSIGAEGKSLFVYSLSFVSISTETYYTSEWIIFPVISCRIFNKSFWMLHTRWKTKLKWFCRQACILFRKTKTSLKRPLAASNLHNEKSESKLNK